MTMPGRGSGQVCRVQDVVASGPAGLDLAVGASEVEAEEGVVEAEPAMKFSSDIVDPRHKALAGARAGRLQGPAGPMRDGATMVVVRCV